MRHFRIYFTCSHILWIHVISQLGNHQLCFETVLNHKKDKHEHQQNWQDKRHADTHNFNILVLYHFVFDLLACFGVKIAEDQADN